MPRYEARTPAGCRVRSVLLDGRECIDEFLKAADTDEGWVDVLEYTVDEAGRRHLKMSEWEPDPRKKDALTRYPLAKRVFGKVEVFTE